MLFDLVTEQLRIRLMALNKSHTAESLKFRLREALNT